MAHRVTGAFVSIAAVVVGVVGGGCSDEGTTEPGTRYRTAPIEDDFSFVPDPRSRWDRYGVNDYLIDVDVLCFCDDLSMFTLVVQDGEVIDLLDDAGRTIASGEDLESYRTIDQAFDWVQSLVDSDPFALRVEYDERYGFPSLVFVDPDGGLADDEYEETRANVRRLVGVE